MAPVHENVVDGAIDRVLGAKAKRALEERLEFRRGHFAGGADELAPLDPAATTDIALDLHVVGRVVDAHLGDLAAHELRVGGFITRVADQKSMVTQFKEGAVQ